MKNRMLFSKNLILPGNPPTNNKKKRIKKKTFVNKICRSHSSSCRKFNDSSSIRIFYEWAFPAWIYVRIFRTNPANKWAKKIKRHHWRNDKMIIQPTGWAEFIINQMVVVREFSYNDCEYRGKKKQQQHERKKEIVVTMFVCYRPPRQVNSCV